MITLENSVEEALQIEIKKTLENVLDYWTTHTIDDLEGGFVGEIDSKGNIIKKAPKGIILNARILWSFSAVLNQSFTDASNEACANRGYQYLKYFFKEKQTSGVHWELNNEGNPIDKTKKTIGQAYTVLALSEYYIFSKKEEVKIWAVDLFEFIEKKFKVSDGSYLNEETKDGVLDKTKTLGTYLHLLEGYTALYRIHKNEALEKRITYLFETIVNEFWKNDNFLVLEFDENWKNVSKTISFGHNVEVPWMLLEIAKTLEGEKYVNVILKKMQQNIASFLKEAITIEGTVLAGRNIVSGKLDYDLNWWVQTEAMLACYTLYKETDKKKYIDNFNRIWNFTKNNFIDYDNGEWHSKITEEGEKFENKVTMWKTPYHIVRMCLNIISINNNA